MQQHPNNGVRFFPSEKGKGITGTIVIHLAVIAILLIFGFSVPPPPETEEGILVNFGMDETGSGLIEPSPATVQEEASPPLPSETSVTSDEEPLLTQNTEEAPVVKKVDPEAEKVRRAELEAERIRKEAEETERKRIAAEEQLKTDIANRTKNALANSRNAGTTSTGEGVTGGEGNQGAPTGSVESQNRGDGSGLGDKGKSVSLEGRGYSKLPDPKYYDYQEGGKVVVGISVDRSGKVTQASPGASGTTIIDENLFRIAKEAALGAQFDSKPDAPEIQKGTITYVFKLK